MKIYKRKYNTNKSGIFVSIREHKVELFAKQYDREFVGSILFDTLNINEDSLEIELYNEFSQIVGIIYNPRQIWDVRPCEVIE